MDVLSDLTGRKDGKTMLNFQLVYELCNKHQWFTEGYNEQYSKMFRMVDEKAPVEEIATVIWLCTNEEKWCRRDILEELRKAAECNE